MSIQNDIKHVLAESGWTQQRLAAESGVNPCGLSKLLNRKGKLSIVERIWPYIYGDKRPPAKTQGDPASSPE